MAQSVSHIAAARKYNDKNYERISVFVRTGDRDKLRAAAESAGMSINMFVLQGGAADVLGWLKEGDEGDEGEQGAEGDGEEGAEGEQS